MLNKQEAALYLLDKAGYVAQPYGDMIVVNDPVHGYKYGGTFGIVDYKQHKIYAYRGTSILAAAVRFIEERS